MSFTADMGRYAGRVTPSLHDDPYRQNRGKQPEDDPLIHCQSLCRQTEPPLRSLIEAPPSASNESAARHLRKNFNRS